MWESQKDKLLHCDSTSLPIRGVSHSNNIALQFTSILRPRITWCCTSPLVMKVVILLFVDGECKAQKGESPAFSEVSAQVNLRFREVDFQRFWAPAASTDLSKMCVCMLSTSETCWNQVPRYLPVGYPKMEAPQPSWCVSRNGFPRNQHQIQELWLPNPPSPC